MIDLLKYVAGLNQIDIKEIEVMPDHGHLWSRAYYIGTVGNMSKETVRKYIRNQRTSKAKSGRKRKSNSSSE